MPTLNGPLTVINNERECILEEELLLVRHSGEIPEVALHASLHYLCEDEEGPKLILADEELRPLQEAALARYREIILRDLDVANRDRSLFRGIRRAIVNWQRCSRFSERTGCPNDDFRREAACALQRYLRQEAGEVGSGQRHPSVNCSADALLDFAQTLGLASADLPDGWSCLCEPF
jgi:hypothetical protein